MEGIIYSGYRKDILLDLVRESRKFESLLPVCVVGVFLLVNLEGCVHRGLDPAIISINIHD